MAEIYSARGWEIPPLPWTNLSPPFSSIRRRGQWNAGSHDPYFQYFAARNTSTFELSIERSSMTRWRDRIGWQGLEKVFQESGSAWPTAPAHCAPRTSEDVTVDTTPFTETGDHLPHRRQAHAQGPPEAGAAGEGARRSPRQSYVRVGKRALIMEGRYRHAKQHGWRVTRRSQAEDLSRAHHPRHPPQDGPSSDLRDIFRRPLWLGERVLTQNTSRSS